MARDDTSRLVHRDLQRVELLDVELLLDLLKGGRVAALSVLATFAAAMFIAPAVNKDVLHRSEAFYLALPIERVDYVLGRFLGACIAASLVYAGAIAGVIAANASIGPEFRGPYHLMAFVHPLLLFALPNLLFTGACSSSRARWRRA